MHSMQLRKRCAATAFALAIASPPDRTARRRRPASAGRRAILERYIVPLRALGADPPLTDQRFDGAAGRL